MDVADADDEPEAKRARILVTVSGGHAQPDRLIEYYKSGKLCDIELRVAGAAFKAHRLVMAACSDTLDRQFAGAGGFSDSASATVDQKSEYMLMPVFSHTPVALAVLPV